MKKGLLVFGILLVSVFFSLQAVAFFEEGLTDKLSWMKSFLMGEAKDPFKSRVRLPKGDDSESYQGKLMKLQWYNMGEKDEVK